MGLELVNSERRYLTYDIIALIYHSSLHKAWNVIIFFHEAQKKSKTFTLSWPVTLLKHAKLFNKVNKTST